jgi:hypothetical protein
MARNIKAIAFMLRASGRTVQHITDVESRDNFETTKVPTLTNIKAIVEIGKKSEVLEKVARIEHDIRFITNIVVDKLDSLMWQGIEYKIKEIENYTNSSNFYIYLGVKSGRI